MSKKPSNKRWTPAEKRERIMTSALEEFVARGFEAASTNAIATRAGVAKGLVFHYFGNKDALYLAVFDWVSEAFQNALQAALDPEPSVDLFERLHEFSSAKLRVLHEHPDHYRFLLQAATRAPSTLAQSIHERLAATSASGWQSFIAGVDYSRLRAGVTPEQALAALMALRDGLERQLLPQILALGADEQALAALTDESLAIFELLRDGIYKRE